MSLENQLRSHTEQDERRFDRLDDRFDMLEDKVDETRDDLVERLTKIEGALSHQKGFIAGVVFVITTLVGAAALALQYFFRR